MVELPWDDAKTEFEKLAAEFNDFTLELSAETKGVLGDALEEQAQKINEFTSAVGMAIQDRPAAAAGEQHSADEELRKAPSPREVARAEVEAKFMALRAQQSVVMPSQAAAFQQKAQEVREQREVALANHTDASSVNAPQFRADPPPLPVLAANNHSGGMGGQQGGGYGAGAGGAGGPAGNSSSPMTGGSPVSPMSGVGSGAGGGSLGDSVSDTEIGTKTSADGMMGGSGMQQPMMGGQQPMMPGQPQPGATGTGQPQGFGTGAPTGMLGGATGSGGARRDKKRDRDLPTDLTGAGAIGAIGGATAAAAAAGVDRGASVTGVTTKADTSGGTGTNLSGAQGKPPGGDGNKGGMLGRAPMGMMGGMGGMGGAGAGGGSGPKEKPDIKQTVRDKDLHGLDSLDHAVGGGRIEGATSEHTDETGTDRFFDAEAWKNKPKPKDF